MTFADKYIPDAENDIKPNKGKILISNEAFAIGEMLEKLLNQLRQN